MWDDKSADKLEKMLAGNFTPELIHKLSAEETAEKIGLPIDMASVHYPLGGWLCPAELTRGLIAQLDKTELLKRSSSIKSSRSLGTNRARFDIESERSKL